MTTPPRPKREEKTKFVSMYAVEAEGHRIGISACLTCGAAILGCMDAHTFTLHEKWHRALARRKR